MTFFKRAIRYCWRQKIRSLILFFIFTLLPCAGLVALSAGHATAEGASEVKRSVGASIHIDLDTSQQNFGAGTQNENGMTYQYNGDYITQDVINAIAQVDGVVGYSGESEDGYWGAAINFQYFPGMFNIDYTGGYGQPVPYTVTLNSQLSKNFLNGTYTLEEGRHITPEDSFAALISKELAEKNGLSVGDTISMYDLDTDSENTFTIVGIFGGTEGMGKDSMMASGIPANQGYIDSNSYQKMWNETVLELGSLDVYVDSAENVQDILKSIKSLPQVKNKTFTYTVDTEDFDLISNPLSSIETMTDTAVLAIAGAGEVLITLLLILWTRGRKKEVGILMALGKCRGEILLQFLAENIFLAIPAAAAAFGLAVLLAQKGGAWLAAQTAEDAALTVVIHPRDIAVVYGIGGMILIFSVLASSVTVMRLKPGAILSQMD